MEDHCSPNLNGFIACVDEDEGCGEISHRTDSKVGILNAARCGPLFGKRSKFDLAITNNCHQNEQSCSELGESYGGPNFDRFALFGKENFKVVDYEVFKNVIDKEVRLGFLTTSGC
jgi:hypothetical protein